MHHAVFDGWSVGVFMRDLGAFYGAAAGQADVPLALPELATRYVDFAAWQRRSLETGVHDAKLDYWRACLADAEPWLDLPTDHPRPAVARNVGHTFSVHLSAELTRRIDEFGRAHGATRFMLLLAVFQLLMGRYAQTTDVSVGSPVSGRTRPEVEDLVGYFVNTVVLRARWSDDPAFTRFLDRVRETTLGAYENQDVPFERVVEEVKPPRDPSRTPLFQVMLAMQDAAVDPDALPGLRVAERFLPGQTAKFDLTLVWEQQPDADGGLYGVLEYDTALFEQPTVQRMLDHYVDLLESALSSPDTPVSRLGLTAAGPAVSELEQSPIAPTATLHSLFAASASRWADQPALVQESRSLSYAELDTRSSAVCAALRSRGIRPGDTVAVRMDRDLDWPVALLGILKAGAAYVPVDVRTPQDRFEHICRDAQVRLVLTLADVCDALAEGADATEPGFEDVHPQSLAYILYTSGTTGLPKGVCVSHANLVHTLERVADRYELGREDRVVQFAALAFDVAAEELFATLLRGGAVVLPPPGPVLGIGELVALAKRESVSVLNLPASYWHEWVSALATHPVSDCAALRLVIAGSERVDPGKLALWQAAVPAGVRWLNGYGPTETTITATVHEPAAVVGRGAAPAATTAVPIGRPLPGVRAHVLDGALNQVPSGVPGDLYISGAGVARGYLNDPARTCCAFLPDPWGPPGSRMYATGDRARRSADGELEFLGREDDQVKLRGFRIELGEIEAALASWPGVVEAAAAVRDSEAGEPVLVGYVASAGAGSSSDAPSIPDIRAHLGARLPAYMVPSTIITLDRLPKNERGKIARAELPAPIRTADTAAGAPPAFAGRHEELVARIWREVLGLDRVGADENFFEIGGQSLLIVRVQARLTETLGRSIPVVDLFRFPTVRGLAAHLAAGAGADAGASQPAQAAGSAGRDRAQARRARQDGISQARRNRASKTATRGD
jgi:amino acid adenylation domain-containing protein